MLQGIDEGFKESFVDFRVFFGDRDFNDFLYLHENYVVPLEPGDESQQKRVNVFFFQELAQLLRKAVNDALYGFEEIEVDL